MSRNGYKTAFELMEDLHNDRDYQEMILKKEEESREKMMFFAKEEKPLLDALNNKGIVVSSVWDLVNMKESYSDAIPILVEHLSKPYHHRIKEGIVRSLGVKEAKGKAGKALIEEFHKTPKDGSDYHWVIGNAMVVVMSQEDEKDVLEIVKDKSNSEARHMFVLGLSRSKSIEVEQVLIDVLDDKEELVVAAAIRSLGKLKSQNAKEKLPSLLHHSSTMVRKEAQKVLKKLS